ncbi:glycosyltransferase [Hymenobacter telluris]|nr:glycosyltransferase [Hymenobacter telluris]
MPRFANYLAAGMQARGHHVEQWTTSPFIYKFAFHNSLKKWFGYIDQYLLFPYTIKKRLKACSSDTLLVLTDQALGPWLPTLAKKPHVVHCHDFLAQHSALGRIPENPTSWTGRVYQAFIRRGYTQGKHFISVSQTTQENLHAFLSTPPTTSAVVYNGLNPIFAPHSQEEARALWSQATSLQLTAGYLLHVGGNQWYKNRIGCIELYNAWRSQESHNLPLLLVGEPPSEAILRQYESSAFKKDIHFLSGFDDDMIRLAYAGATVFLFPSLAEGFGWPIAEAMAAGCLVVTTQEAPMTEVGGTASFYIPRRPSDQLATEWAAAAAETIQQVVALTPVQRQKAVDAGLKNAQRFSAAAALDAIEAIYKQCLQPQHV